MTSQVFIASYAKDFCWLIHCLGSLKRFASGFLHPVVCVASEDYDGAVRIVAQSYPEARVVIRDGREGQGFMRAQIAMMRADELCPEADFIFLLGSDCLATCRFTPVEYFTTDGKPAMLFSSYESLKSVHSDTFPWQTGVNRILGFKPVNEYMRRLPIVYPRALFPAMRSFIAVRHGKDFDDFIYSDDVLNLNTSESNLLGAYAHRYMPSLYYWVDIAEAGMHGVQVKGWPNVVCQFWSHGGLDLPTDRTFHYGFGKMTIGRTPREIINEILYGNMT